MMTWCMMILTREKCRQGATAYIGPRTRTLTHAAHLLVSQLPRYITRAGPRDLNPRLGEERARGEHERDVEQGVEGVRDDVREVARGRHVVREPADGDGLPALRLLPASQETHEDVILVALVQHLREEVQVRDEGGEQDDGHVARVEELDGVRALLPTEVLVLERQLHLEALDVDDDEENQDRRAQVREVGEVGPEEGLLQRLGLRASGVSGG